MSDPAAEVREALDTSLRAFNAGDFESAFAGLAPDVEWRMGPWIPDGGVLLGRRRVIDFYKQLQDAGGWTVTTVEVERVTDSVFLVHQRGEWTGRSSGLSGIREFFQVFEIGDQGTERVTEFATRDEAQRFLDG